MSNPHCDGGLRVLNLKAQNEAIRIMKLKKLANHSTSQPLASDAALEIILTCTQQCPTRPTPDSPTLTDIFLQSFLKCKCLTSKQLPQDLKAILNTGARHNLTLNSLNFCIDHKLNLPAWFHPGKDTNTKNCKHKSTSKCLWNTHNVCTVFNLIIHETHHENPQHTENNKSCPCQNCSLYKSRGCPHPHRCFKEACLLLVDLSPKFDPFDDIHLFDKNITDNDQMATSTNAISPAKNIKIFNSSTTSLGDIHEHLHIFVNPKKLSLSPARRALPSLPSIPPSSPMAPASSMVTQEPEQE